MEKQNLENKETQRRDLLWQQSNNAN